MFRQSARKLTKTKITAVSNTHALIVMVSLAFNAVTNMEPRPGMENTLSTIELPAIINPKLCASMVINGGNAKRLTIFAIFHSDTPRALAYNTKSLLYPSKREERNTRMVPADVGIANARAGRTKSFRLSAPIMLKIGRYTAKASKSMKPIQ